MISFFHSINQSIQLNEFYRQALFIRALNTHVGWLTIFALKISLTIVYDYLEQLLYIDVHALYY